jgi:hypothetical protein
VSYRISTALRDLIDLAPADLRVALPSEHVLDALDALPSYPNDPEVITRMAQFLADFEPIGQAQAAMPDRLDWLAFGWDWRKDYHLWIPARVPDQEQWVQLLQAIDRAGAHATNEEFEYDLSWPREARPKEGIA